MGREFERHAHQIVKVPQLKEARHLAREIAQRRRPRKLGGCRQRRQRWQYRGWRPPGREDERGGGDERRRACGLGRRRRRQRRQRATGRDKHRAVRGLLSVQLHVLHREHGLEPLHGAHRRRPLAPLALCTLALLTGLVAPAASRAATAAAAHAQNGACSRIAAAAVGCPGRERRGAAPRQRASSVEGSALWSSLALHSSCLTRLLLGFKGSSLDDEALLVRRRNLLVRRLHLLTRPLPTLANQPTHVCI